MIFKCRKCGMENELTDAYCQGCGNDLNLYGEVVFASQQPEPEPAPQPQSQPKSEPEQQPKQKPQSKKVSEPKKNKKMRVIVEIICFVILLGIAGVVGIICYDSGKEEGVYLGREKERKLLEPYLVEKTSTPQISSSPEGLIYRVGMSFSDGVYTGGTKNGQPHGIGTCSYKNGDVYEGEWKEGKKERTGKYTWKNGDIYEGEWKEGKREGTGKYTWKDGDIYEGEWKNDKKNGLGKFTWKDGDIYEGEYKEGKRDGTGKCTWEEGGKIYIYDGEWKNDKENGLGTLISKDGKEEYKGEWKDNIIYSGSRTYTATDGNVYKEVFAYGKKISTEQVKE